MNHNTNRDKIADEIAKELGLSKSLASELVKDIIQIMIKSILEYGKLNIACFGNFILKKKSARIGRNPNNKTSYPIKERELISFKTSSFFKSYLNNDSSDK